MHTDTLWMMMLNSSWTFELRSTSGRCWEKYYMSGMNLSTVLMAGPFPGWMTCMLDGSWEGKVTLPAWMRLGLQNWLKIMISFTINCRSKDHTCSWPSARLKQLSELVALGWWMEHDPVQRRFVQVLTNIYYTVHQWIMGNSVVDLCFFFQWRLLHW